MSTGESTDGKAEGEGDKRTAKKKGPVISYRWQFVSPDFAGWPDGRAWTRFEAGPHTKGATPEGPEGPTHTMPQRWIDDIALHLENMVTTFELQGNTTEAAWHRGRTRSATRTMLVRVRIVPAEEAS